MTGFLRRRGALRFGLSIVFLALVPFPKQATAQRATAQLTGTIHDVSHAVVVGARVTLKNSGTNVERTAFSDKEGNYLFTLVPIGIYELSVEEAGFTKYVRTGITLEINQNAHLDVNLAIGTTNQVIEVQGNVTQVDTVSATLGKVETTAQIENLPLAARDTMQLGLLQAGVFAPDQDDGSGNVGADISPSPVTRKSSSTSTHSNYSKTDKYSSRKLGKKRYLGITNEYPSANIL